MPGRAHKGHRHMRHKAKAGPMTGGMAIVEALVANGVDTVFGLPGAQLYPLFDALEQRSDRVRTIGARHEQACGYMAFGYACSRSCRVPASSIRRRRWLRLLDAARPCCA
jgi:hypothetical protein